MTVLLSDALRGSGGLSVTSGRHLVAPQPRAPPGAALACSQVQEHLAVTRPPGPVLRQGCSGRRLQPAVTSAQLCAASWAGRTQDHHDPRPPASHFPPKSLGFLCEIMKGDVFAALRVYLYERELPFITASSSSSENWGGGGLSRPSVDGRGSDWLETGPGHF